MTFAQDIIIKPIITENSMMGIADKKYTFQVAKDANKIEIAKAVEELFGVKVSKVAEAVAQNAELIYCGLENGGIGVEDNGGAVIFFSTFSNYFHFACGLAKSVFLHIYFAFTAHFGAKVVAKCVHTTYAHTVQTARHFIGAFVELTAGVQHSHHHLKCRLVEFFMLVHRNATAVVAHGDGVVFANGHSDLVAETCKGFVDRVIYNF